MLPVDAGPNKHPNTLHRISVADKNHAYEKRELFCSKRGIRISPGTVNDPCLSLIRGFGQRVRCVWRNKEPTPKGEDVKLITQGKHMPDTIA